MISKLVWYLERSRTYRALKRHDRVRRHFNYGNLATLAVLTTPKCLDDAVWSLWSWMRALEGKITPRLFVDGTVAAAERQLFDSHFPGIRIDELRPWLATRNEIGPYVRKLIDSFPLGGKAALVACLGLDGNAIYSDSDILAFNAPNQLIDGVMAGSVLYMQDRYGSNYDQVISTAMAAKGLTLPPQVNSGLIALPKQKVTPAMLEGFLTDFTDWKRLQESWFSEQTLTAMLMGMAHGTPLDRDQYVVSLDRQFVFERDVDYRSITARHFTGPVRHVMYLKGIPHLMTLAERT
jgi:hypothetical protein